jgi:arsenate reductase-like glutaredoxin family protein
MHFGGCNSERDALRLLQRCGGATVHVIREDELTIEELQNV